MDIYLCLLNGCYSSTESTGEPSGTSATTLVSVRNTRVFWTALTALTEPCTLWRRITRLPSPRRRVVLRTYILYSSAQCILVTGSVRELSDQNHRVVKLQSLLDWCSGLQVHLGAPGSTWEHLGARWITVEQSGKNIFFGNAVGASGNHNVFSSMYLGIYIATYLHTVYLDWQQAVIQSN